MAFTNQEVDRKEQHHQQHKTATQQAVIQLLLVRFVIWIHPASTAGENGCLASPFAFHAGQHRKMNCLEDEATAEEHPRASKMHEIQVAVPCSC